MYLTYGEYQNMGGTLDETTFNDFEFEAETQVNWYTFNRLEKVNEDDYPDKLKKCMFHIIRLLKAKSDTLLSSSNDGGSSSGGVSKTIASQSNDGVSISYSVLSAETAYKTADKELEFVITRYLSGVKDSLGRYLLYRGVYPNE